eukprot:scaffold90767_cov78-Phaeocystis_antarctica.AAC.3
MDRRLIERIAHARRLAAPVELRSTAQHSTAQHSTAQHSTAQHSTAQHTEVSGAENAPSRRGGRGGIKRRSSSHTCTFSSYGAPHASPT